MTTAFCPFIQFEEILLSCPLVQTPAFILMKHSLLALLLLITCPLYVAAETRHTGEIGGSGFIVDVPDEATGDVLFLARGYRPDTLPLSAVYEKETAFFQTLRKEGWTIASPSFQGNRWVMADGAADIIALRAHVDAEIIKIKRAFLYGESMGGGIIGWLAEQAPEGFDGAIALGAYLYQEPKGETPPNPKPADYLPGKPGFPIILLTNNVEAEIAGSRDYAKRAAGSTLAPVLWTVNRSGHVNLNSAERLKALRAVIDWSDTRKAPSPMDATIVMDPVSVAAIHANTAAARITRTRPLYGNIYTSFVAGDLSRLDITLGDTFNLTHGKQTVNATFATTYNGVPLGEWVAFIDPEGRVQISRNYANATATFGALKGDVLLISATE